MVDGMTAREDLEAAFPNITIPRMIEMLEEAIAREECFRGEHGDGPHHYWECEKDSNEVRIEG